jgi:GntR family transcriptional regulator, arabinose operon transcriptional repressor
LCDFPLTGIENYCTMYVELNVRTNFYRSVAGGLMDKPKYEVVKDYLIEYIQNEQLKFDDVIPTESDLMEKLQVSRHTIRKAISDLVNKGWLYSHQGRGTYVLDPKADNKLHGKMIGVITTYFKDYIFPEILSGVDNVLSEEGYSILLGTTKNNSAKERVVLQNMLNNQLAGLIVEPTKSVYPNHNLDLYEKFIHRGIPIVFIHATYRDLEESYIVEDDRFAGYIATKHLIDYGHRKIVGIFKQDDVQGHGRYNGFVEAHNEAKLAETDNVIWFSTEERKKFMSEAAVEQWIKTYSNCTAFVCYNDEIACELMEKLKNLKLSIPEDISIVSFDNSNLADKLTTTLTTVAHPKAILGEKAAKAILSMIENPKHKITEVIRPELIIRNSTQKR